MQDVLTEDVFGIRRFKNPDIQKGIEDAIQRLENKNHKFIAIGHTDETGEYKLTAAIKMGDHFSIAAAFYDNWRRPTGLKFETDVVFSI